MCKIFGIADDSVPLKNVTIHFNSIVFVERDTSLNDVTDCIYRLLKILFIKSFLIIHEEDDSM